MLKIEDVNKKFNEKTILKNINITVKRGEIAVFLGKSGVGKSTLLRVLNNLDTADSGSLYLDNQKLDFQKIKRKHIIGMVFQLFNLFKHLTVEQNITLALEKVLKKSNKESKKIAHNLIKRYELAGKEEKFISELSGGQKQRLAIARTIALKPQIICLDEPTSSLDPMLTTQVAKNIQELAGEGYIVLVATHDVELLKKLDSTIYLMKNGIIIESVKSIDFFKNKVQYPFMNKFISGTI